MHTIDELRAELRAQADDAPTAGELLDAQGIRTSGSTARRATRGPGAHRRHLLQALAVAACVVAVAVAGTVIVSNRSGRHDATVPTVSGEQSSTPDSTVPRIPAGSKLQPIDLAVTAPVTVPAIAGLQRSSWGYSDNRLWWFFYDTSGRKIAGLSVGADRDAPLVPGGDGKPVIPTASPAGTSGEYWLTGPKGSVDKWGLNADRRLTRQLPNGQWIQFFGSTEQLMRQLADGTTPGRTPLARDVTIGLTIPGYTEDELAPADTVVEDPDDQTFTKKIIRTGTSAAMGLCKPPKAAAENTVSSPTDCLNISVAKYATPPTLPASVQGGVRNLAGGLSISLEVPSGAKLRQDEIQALLDSIAVSPGLADRLPSQG